MTRALSALAVKELRAVLPAWLACVAAVAAGGLVSSVRLRELAFVAYGLGAIATGAQSVGHEYTHRTLGLLLSQPVSRTAVYLVKLAVLAALLVILGATAFYGPVRAPGPVILDGPLVVLIGLCGLCLAPPVTLLCRSSVAGLVFAIAVPAVLRTGAELAAVGLPELRHADAIDRFMETVFSPVVLALCGVAVPTGWWLFTRLEAVEGGGAPLRLAAGTGGSARMSPPAVRRGVIRHLVAKELHLHQMALVLAGLCALNVGAIAIGANRSAAVSTDAILPILFIYIGTLPLVIGSMASAEERQLGTLQWQVLLPAPAWQQWTVKVGVAMALSLALAAALPLLLATAADARIADRLWQTIFPVVGLTIIGIYVSSLSGSGIRALVLAVPATVACVLIFVSTSWALYRILPPIGYGVFIRRGLSRAGFSEGWAILTAAMPLAVLLLNFGYRNHRTGERPATQFRAQVGWIVGLFVAELSLLMIVLG